MPRLKNRGGPPMLPPPPSPPEKTSSGWLKSLAVAVVIAVPVIAAVGDPRAVPATLAERGPDALRPTASRLAHGDEPRNEVVATTARSMRGRTTHVGMRGSRPMVSWMVTRRAFGAAGLTLPKDAGQQARLGKPVKGLAKAKRGDLLAWDTGKRLAGLDHVAVYLGDGRAVDAPGKGKPVREFKVATYGKPGAIRRLV